MHYITYIVFVCCITSGLSAVHDDISNEFIKNLQDTQKVTATELAILKKQQQKILEELQIIKNLSHKNYPKDNTFVAFSAVIGIFAVGLFTSICYMISKVPKT